MKFHVLHTSVPLRSTSTTTSPASMSSLCSLRMGGLVCLPRSRLCRLRDASCPRRVPTSRSGVALSSRCVRAGGRSRAHGDGDDAALARGP
eukprot:543744-Amphidinium_carterae.1